MVPLNLLSKLVPRTQLGTLPRSLGTTWGLQKQCGGGGKNRDAEDICRESKPCKSGKKKKTKFCDKAAQEESKADDLPDTCSAKAALECARKIEELQKQWEAVARSVERAEAAAQLAGSKKRASGCPVKPPAKPQKEHSVMPIVLGLLAVVAGVAYYLYTQSQEGGDEKKEGEDKDK